MMRGALYDVMIILFFEAVGKPAAGDDNEDATFI